jgi:hypothetical protein
MDKFLDAYNQQKFNQKDIKHLNSLITCNEIEAVIKSVPTKKGPGPDGFMAKFHQTFKEELIPILLKLFQEIESEGTLPNSFYEVSITLILKPNKDATRKQNFRQIYLMNIDANIINKIMANRIQQHIKKTIHHDQVSFIPGIQGWFNIPESINVIQHINRSKDKNNMILSIGTKKLNLFPKHSQKLLEIINSFSKVMGHKINIQKSVAFLYINNKQTEKKSWKQYHLQ